MYTGNLAWDDEGTTKALGVIAQDTHISQPVNVVKQTAGDQAYARPLPENTQSQQNQTVPLLSGPSTRSQRIEVNASLSDCWDKCQQFCASLENTDLEILSTYKAQGYFYQLPRYTMFRLQVFRQQEGQEGADEPLVVEFQRREGDGYLHGLLFVQLRNFLVPESAIEFDSTTDISNTPLEFTQLHLENEEDDLAVFISHLFNSHDLLAARSGSNTIALACQNPANFTQIISRADDILGGMQELLQISQDPSTVFACIYVLATLGSDPTWCSVCITQPNLLSIICNLFPIWSNQEPKKQVHTSTQILIQAASTLKALQAFDFDWFQNTLTTQDRNKFKQGCSKMNILPPEKQELFQNII